jgi:hypothetical protein
MANREYHAEQTTTTTPFMPITSGLIAMGQRHIHDCVKAQSELVDTFQEASRSWLDHCQREADLSAELASKMTAVRSIPDAAAILLEWTNRHMEMATVDAKHVLADTHKVMEIGVRFVPRPWLFNGKSADGSTRAPAADAPPTPYSYGSID